MGEALSGVAGFGEPAAGLVPLIWEGNGGCTRPLCDGVRMDREEPVKAAGGLIVLVPAVASLLLSSSMPRQQMQVFCALGIPADQAAAQ
ncbi:glycerol-3-phosphate dehydrogenase [NAD(P)+] [Burkholderiales bacterium GJ-E10]|nr:glycerol-3-phosphate dehydrogenase [NAD(P)+] [Burkholderiales bacterium GJ-E10]